MIFIYDDQFHQNYVYIYPFYYVIEIKIVCQRVQREKKSRAVRNSSQRMCVCVRMHVKDPKIVIAFCFVTTSCDHIQTYSRTRNGIVIKTELTCSIMALWR